MTEHRSPLLDAAAARSRRMLRAALIGGGTEATARAKLQRALGVLFRLMFWSLATLIALLGACYELFPEIAPAARAHVYLGAAVGLATMAAIGRTLLATSRELTVVTLYRLDLVYSLGIGAAFGASAYLQHDLRPAGYLSALYAGFTVLARALIVPSSARRTAVACLLTWLPMTAAAGGIAINYRQELPPLAFFIGYLLLSFVPIVLAIAGSDIIYGLRREADDARQLGAYVFEDLIARGGMGTVHRAHHRLLRRPTAIKMLAADRLSAEDHDRFEREVQHTSELTHPNTVAVYDYGRAANGEFYYAMEYLGGGLDLEQLVARDGPQPAGRIANVMAQVCGALAEAHARGIVHHDIKPNNIILCQRGGLPDFVKVVDFGLAKEFAADTGASRQIVLGTPDYMAPEAVVDPGSVGPPADLYALGAVGYFLLTGRRVFQGATAVELCAKHVSELPRKPSEVAAIAIDAALEAIVMRCLAKRPGERFPSARALAEALRGLRLTDWDDARARAWWQERS